MSSITMTRLFHSNIVLRLSVDVEEGGGFLLDETPQVVDVRALCRQSLPHRF